MGERWIDCSREKVKKEWVAAFLSALIIGFCVHAFKMTNPLPNHDTLYSFYGDQNLIGSGRWFLSLACGVSSYFDLPWVNLVLSLLYIALTAVVVVEILNIKSAVLAVLTSALLVSFVGTTETFLFSFTADGFLMAMLFGAISVYLTRIENAGAIKTTIAVVLVCLCCAIYQAYVSFSMMLMLCYFVMVLLQGAATAKDIKRFIGRQLIVYIGGLALYYVLWKLLMFLQGVQATQYQGIDTVGFSLSTMIGGVPRTVRSLIFLFFERNIFTHGVTAYAVLNVVFLSAAVIAVFGAIINSKLYRRKGNLILTLVTLVAMPFVWCMWHFASPDVAYRPMMLHSVCLFYVFVAILCHASLGKWVKNAMVILCVVIICNNALMANISYNYMNRSYESTYANATEMMGRIHMLDGNSNRIAVIGDIRENVGIEAKDEHAGRAFLLTAGMETNMLFDGPHLVSFLNEMYFCEYTLENLDVKHDQQLAMKVAEMGCWPQSNSIQIINDVIVIKLSEAMIQ